MNIFDYLKELHQERYRVLLIHTEPLSSSQLSRFGQKLSKHSGGKYLDCLNFFLNSPQLADSLDRFSPEQFRTLLIQQSQNLPLLTVDRLDFLLDTWSQLERQRFFQLARDQWDGYKEQTKTTLIFCLQSSHEIASLNIFDSKGRSRVLPLSIFDEIAEGRQAV